MRSGAKGVTITQFDLEPVERMGLVKIDLLGIRGLTVLGDVAELVTPWRPDRVSAPAWPCSNSIPIDDPLTSELVGARRHHRLFPDREPRHARHPARHPRPQRGRPDGGPGAVPPRPAQGGLRDAFVRRLKARSRSGTCTRPWSRCWQDTFGVILYQEQVLRIAHALAGFSLAEADLLRRAMSHFDPGKQMQILQKTVHRRGAGRTAACLRRGRRADLGDDGGLCRLRFSQGARRLVRAGGLALGLVQEPTSRPSSWRPCWPTGAAITASGSI